MIKLPLLSRAIAEKRRENDEFMAEVRVWQAEAQAHAERIERAVTEAGFPPRMLDTLPPGHIAAALALGVK